MALSLLCMKLVLISTGVLSVVFAVKNSVPLVVDFSTTQAPAIWSGFCSWLKPPFLYVIINGIIISIAASSRFYNTNQSSPLDEERERVTVSDLDDCHVSLRHQSYGYVEEIETINKSVEDDVDDDDDDVAEETKSVLVTESTWTPRTDLPEIQSPPVEKPLVSSRFCQRKPSKLSPEGGGRTLGVTKPKRQETLENTWKKITEGRSMPLNRYLKKSETFAENFNGTVEAYQVKKSETFKDRTNYQSPSPSPSPVKVKTPLKLRKEPTLNNDELNRRVEAFIKKFNQDMRMQRQESINQYKEIVDR
ncbi:hypothetical protein ACFE04_002857 [Oxalis oulophora]